MNFTYHNEQLNYSYGLRRVPREISDTNGSRKNLFVAVRVINHVDGSVEEVPLCQPASRPFALGSMLEVIDNDSWGADDESRPKPQELKEELVDLDIDVDEPVTVPETPRIKKVSKAKVKRA